MQEQLNNIFGSLAQRTGPQVSPLAFLMLMAISLVCSLFIAYLYVHFYSSRATGSQVHRAFPLLGISITAIFISIQFSLPLSLGLLGLLPLRVGRPPGRQDPAAFLLSNFPASAREDIEVEISRAADAVESLVMVGLERTQSAFNS